MILVPDRKDASLVEFHDILTYLEQRDAAGAERAMRYHLMQLRQSLYQAASSP